MNKCIFYGNLTKDPEIFQTQNGEKMVRVTIATHRVVNNEKRTEFIPCLAFRKNAELLEQYYQKGRPILVEARVVNSKGKTKNGEEYNTFSFIIERFEFAGSGRKEQTQEQTTSVQPAEPEISEDELEKELEEFFEEDESFEPPPVENGVITLESESPF